jgi:hypothetical protein
LLKFIAGELNRFRPLLDRPYDKIKIPDIPVPPPPLAGATYVTPTTTILRLAIYWQYNGRWQLQLPAALDRIVDRDHPGRQINGLELPAGTNIWWASAHISILFTAVCFRPQHRLFRRTTSIVGRRLHLRRANQLAMQKALDVNHESSVISNFESYQAA